MILSKVLKIENSAHCASMFVVRFTAILFSKIIVEEAMFWNWWLFKSFPTVQVLVGKDTFPGEQF
jgi:hypothetical protein